MNSSDWDSRYSSVEHPWGSAPATALVNRFAGLTPGRAVDLGCGDGRHARYLTEAGWTVQAVDFSPVAIELAAGDDADRNPRAIEYSVGDAITWEPLEPVDLVVMSFLHLPVDDLVAVIAGAGNWLAPGGRLLYLGHALENYTHGIGGPQEPEVLPDIDDLARAASGMYVHELAHLIRPHGDGDAIDILLHMQPWKTVPHRRSMNGTHT